LKAYKFILALLFFYAPHKVVAQDADVTAAPAQQTGLVQYSSRYINSLLNDKEVPLLGGNWSGEIMVDAPLNSEPEDAQVVLRRAKLRYARSFGENWLVKLSANYTKGGGLEVADTKIVYSGWNTALLSFGIFSPPFSLESVSSSAALTFMETSLAVSALAERQSGGLAFLKRTPKHIFDGMLVFLNPKEDDLRQSGQAIIGHYVYSPIGMDKTDSIHIGGSFSYRVNAEGKSTQFRSRPEIATADNYFVDTGTISDADKVLRAGFEASRVAGRFSWQTELLVTRVTRKDAEKLNFWGAYAHASWFLTNDSRNYDSGTGSFEIVTPSAPFMRGGWGAFEVAARASFVDLTSKDLIGGKERNISLGLNWYLNEKVRVMTNLIKVLSVNRPGNEFDNQNPLILGVRAQWLMR
jgi:phosphate-selective porin OprO/OprP